MNSFPDWSVFQERETVATSSELLSPASGMAALLHASSSRLFGAQQALDDLEQKSFAEFAQQAVLAVQLGMQLERNAHVFLTSSDQKPANTLYHVYKSLQIIQKQMLDRLKKAGLEIEIPLHKLYAEVIDSVEIDHWRHHQDFSEEFVIDVLEPVIRKGPLLRSGRVVMGAPLAAQSPGAPEETEQIEQESRKDSQR